MPSLKRLYHVVRPVLSFIPVGSFMIGSIMSLFDPFSWSLYRHSSVFMFLVLSILSLPVFLLSYLSVFLLGVSSSCLNSLVDAADSDLKGFRKDYQNPVVYHGVSPFQMKIITVFSAAVSFVISLYVSFVFAALVLVGNLVSISYSYYPRMKMRAPFDVVWNAVGLFALPFISGWIVYHSSSQVLVYSFCVYGSSFYFLAGEWFDYLLISMLAVRASWFPFHELLGGSLIGGAFYVITAVLDYDSDKEACIKTIGVLLGKRYALLFSLALYASGVLIMFDHLVFDVGTILLTSSIAIFMIYLVIKPEKTGLWNLLKLALITTLILIALEIILRVSIH
nr:UbiA family prenyltransferase [Candidatus Freyarchaeota archaeon]